MFECFRYPNRNETPGRPLALKKWEVGGRPAIGGRRSGGADCFWRSALGGRQSSLEVGGRVENSAVGAHHSSPKRRSLAVGYSESLQS